MFSPLLLVTLLAGAAEAGISPATMRPLSATSRLISYGPDDSQVAWVEQEAIWLLRENDVDLTTARKTYPELLGGLNDEVLQRLGSKSHRGAGFMDVTGLEYVRNATEHEAMMKRQSTYPTPNPSKYPALSTYFSQVTASGMSSTVATLSNYTTRYYRSSNAAAPATWIQSQLSSALGSSNVKLISNSFSQPNVIGTIPAKSGSTATDVVIIGAHLDSIVGSGSTTARAPGADDDASGIAVIIQAAQILAKNGYRGTRPIEFHAYAGEEGGLLGSKTVASQYKSAGRTVRAMLQMDMVAYQPSSTPRLTVLTDTTSSLVTFSKSLISSYLSSDTLDSNSCGYACSDHFSFYNQGYPSVSIDESGPNDQYLNPYYHTAQDTIDKLNFNRAAEFVKMAMAFIVELSG